MPTVTTTIHRNQRDGDRHRRRDQGGDGEVAGLRVSLKLASLAYTNLCVGTSSSPDLASASVTQLCRAAARYFLSLVGPYSVSVPDEESSVVASLRLRLQVAAVAYASTRHGVDACTEFTRAAIGELCQAAIGYAGELTRPGATHDVVDPTMHLDDGR